MIDPICNAVRGPGRLACAVVLCAHWLASCSSAPEIVTARLALAELPSCDLGRRERLSLRASGDFPTIEAELSGAPPYAIDALPHDTRWLAIEAQTADQRAGALVALHGQDQEARALLLPLSVSCPLGDPLLVAPPGAAVAALPDGGFLIAGGRDAEGAATARAVVLRAGAALGDEVSGGMLLRRAGASATRVGNRVIVAGGAPDERGPAHDTFEVYDAVRARFDPAFSAKLAAGPRRDHGAAALPDGRVLIVGGLSELDSEPLASAELIDAEAGLAQRTAGELAVARTAPQVLALGGGSALVALGRDAGGRVVTEVERFDPESGRFELAGALPAHAHAAVAVLEGDRVAYVGCDEGDEPDRGACELGLLLPRGEGFELADPGVAPEELAAAGALGLRQLRALALRDGRLLVTGREPGAAVERRAFVVDFNRAAAAPASDLSRVPDHLVALEDGSIAELDAAGASLRREDVRSALEDPPEELLAEGELGVALDLGRRWAVEGGGLRALSEARFDLPAYRFAAVRVRLELEGEAQLLLEPEGAAPVTVDIDDRAAALGDCRLSRAAADALVVERSAGEVVLRSGGSSRRCAAPQLDARVSIALVAAPSMRLSALHVERL